LGFEAIPARNSATFAFLSGRLKPCHLTQAPAPFLLMAKRATGEGPARAICPPSIRYTSRSPQSRPAGCLAFATAATAADTVSISEVAVPAAPCWRPFLGCFGSLILSPLVQRLCALAAVTSAASEPAITPHSFPSKVERMSSGDCRTVKWFH
jgi:hypothetical protein